MIEIVKAEPRHAAIVPYLRQADVDEIWSFTGISPASAISYSLAFSEYARAILLDGKPVVLFGVTGVPASHGKTGVPWLVATEEIEKHPVRFYRMSKAVIATMRQKYDCLMNWVDIRNTLSIRWLKWAGFTVEEPEPWGVYGKMFHCFWWRR
jgi:hypothetical protein